MSCNRVHKIRVEEVSVAPASSLPPSLPSFLLTFSLYHSLLFCLYSVHRPLSSALNLIYSDCCTSILLPSFFWWLLRQRERKTTPLSWKYTLLSHEIKGAEREGKRNKRWGVTCPATRTTCILSRKREKTSGREDSGREAKKKHQAHNLSLIRENVNLRKERSGRRSSFPLNIFLRSQCRWQPGVKQEGKEGRGEKKSEWREEGMSQL